MDHINYLKRFQASDLTEPSFEHLAELQFRHMQHVPFENLDVIRRVPIYLNLLTIYEKLVTARRGGYCYELNGLFHWLLNMRLYLGMRAYNFFTHAHISKITLITSRHMLISLKV